MNVIDSMGDEPIGNFGLSTLYHLTYCSRAAAGLDRPAVDRLVAVAQRRNPAMGITGMLVFGSGIFFQWLEGPRDQVTKLMTSIKRDDRHDTIVALTESEEVRERLFPNWAMELVEPDDVRAVLEDALSTVDDEKNVQALRRLLQQIDGSGMGADNS
jgi:hypothetical protein